MQVKYINANCCKSATFLFEICKTTFYLTMAAQLHVANYISSKRGKPILIDHNSHEYRLKSETGASKYWDCRRRDSAKCPARAITVIQVICFIAYICKNI